MSEKKANKQRYWVTYLLKDLGVGETFKPTARHLTIIPWFVTKRDNKQVVKYFQEHFSTQKSFRVTVAAYKEFESSHKIPVNPISPSEQLLSLHKNTLEWFDFLEAKWAVKNPYVGEEYVPHIRRRAGHNLSEGDVLNISSLSLVGADRRSNDLRTVIARVSFR